MRPFFIVIVLFAVAVGIAVSAHLDPGNVGLFYPPYRVEMSLNLFVTLLAVLFVVLYAMVRLASKTVQMPERVSEYRQRQRERRAYRALRGTLQSYLEGRFGHAEKQAGEAQELPEAGGLASLVAARAAHRMTEYGRRDEWLRRADQIEGLRAARLMTEAECLVDARDSARALSVVSQLHAAGARHIQSLRVALKANQYAGQWEEVLRLLRSLNKRDAIHPAAAQQIKVLAYRSLLDARSSDGYGLIAFWQDVPQSDRRLPEIARAAARVFNTAGLSYQARVVLETALAQEWNSDLVAEYGACAEENSTSQIDRAERWLSAHPADAHLKYALGILCSRQRLWGKAQAYLAQALELGPPAALSGRIHLALARVAEEIDHPNEAALHFREAALALDAAEAR
ncbi:MAG: heme biosynthesis protein HemY [Burkholderiaceae bacterium]|jgi:HemY protein